MKEILEKILDLLSPDATKVDLAITAKHINLLAQKIDVSQITDDEQDRLFLLFGNKFIEVLSEIHK